MNKKFTKLIAALALLVFMTPSLAGWGQTRATKTEGFETATAGTDYQSTITVTTANSDCGVSWEIYYGNVSTSSAISGNNSAALRLYNSDDYGYIKTTTAIDGLSQVKMKAKAATTNNALIKINVQYSSDGTTWTNIETDKELTSSAIEYTFAIPSGGKFFQVAISSNSTKPTKKNAQLTIDDVEFTYSNVYTVTYNANGGNGEDFIDNNGGEGYESGATVTVLANTFTKTGHDFFCWSDMEDGGAQGANLYDPDDTFEITGNTTLYAQWSVNKYNVAIASVANVDLYAEYSTNETLIEGENADIDYGTTLTLTADGLAQGSAFVWQVTDGDNNDVTEDVLNGNILTVPAYNITISGSVEQNYTVIFDSNGVETIVSQAGNSVFSLAAPTNVPTGFTFVGWTMYETELDVNDLLEGATVDLSDYYTDNASLYAVFSGEVGAFPAIPATPDSFVKVEEELSDWSGTYLIVNEAYGLAFDGSLTPNLDIDGNTVSVTILNSNTITATDALVTSGFTIEKDFDNENYPYTIKSASGYYIGRSTTGNGIDFNQETQYGNNIEYNNENDKVDITGVGGNKLQYYYQKNSSSRFRYYGSSQKAIQLYKYVEGAPGAPAIGGTTQRFIRVFQNETAEDDVFILGPSIIPSGYYLDMGDYEILSEDADMFIIEDGGQLISDQDDEVYATVWKNIRSRNNGGGWNFVASPIFTGEGLNPSTVGMITNSDYDLYRFNSNAEADAQGITKEWENYKVHQNDQDGFLLYNGHGYLYANVNDVILQFSGVVNSPDAVVSYDYDDESESEMKDWQLVGNPYMYEAYPNTSYYVVNGFGVEPKTNSKVAPCEGIMIQGTDGFVEFTREESEGSSIPSNLQMTVAQQVVNRSGVSTVINDKAIVSFNEGNELGKFYFGDNAKLYIPQNGKDYAIAVSDAQGELPVNFKVAENGTYTLSIDAENVEMNYLHLIDNMTGMDIDLLQTPIYTFEATTRDYESRFRLVFAANEDGVSTGSTAFAFFSNGNWIINNAGNATLQVIDLTGRILSSESVNGSVSTTLNATPGVYMLRLINGDNVKVQKIVVR